MTSLAKPIVLVVEDEPLVRMIAVDMIEEAGWAAIEAADAAEALNALSQGNVDVLFTDINMPGEMDGLELAECVHSIRPQIQLVITSGKRAFVDIELPDDSSFLPKPYRSEQLVTLIESKLQS